MTAAARVSVAAVLVIAGSLAMLWAGTRPLELLAGTVRLLVMAAAVAAAGLALSALQPPKGGRGWARLSRSCTSRSRTTPPRSHAAGGTRTGPGARQQ